MPIISAINSNKTGITIAIMDVKVAVKSSNVLIAKFPVPPVVAVTTGLTATDYAACTLPATSTPAAIASTGCSSLNT